MPISSSAFKRTTATMGTSTSSASSSSPRPVGELQLLDDKTGQVISKRRVYANRKILIGRDRTRCQWSFNDSHLSAKHLRIYTVLYDNEQDSRVDPLVYAEDLSRYGTYWNGSLIGKGSGGYLLSNEDKLRLSSTITLQFRSLNGDSDDVFFDMTQEREMNGFRDEYIITDRLLGAGADGRVFMAIEFSTRSQVACKVIDLRRLRRRGNVEDLPERPAAATEVDVRAQLYKVKVWADHHKHQLEDSFQRYSREVEILTSIRHPNIISVDKVFVTDNTIYIFQDLITAGDLFSYMEMKNHKLLECEAAVILRQITIALQFLHQKFIVHRDLKPDNIMVTSMAAGARVVLTDFGSARRVQSQMQRMRSVIGTPGYVAPEVTDVNSVMRKQLKVGYTIAVDMWSLGVVSVLLLTGISAFSGPITTCHSAAMRSIFDLSELQNTTEWKAVRERPKDFVSRLLVLDESIRMTADQALKHTWFSNDFHKIDFEDLYKRTIKNWHPRVPKIPVIAFQKGRNFKPSTPNTNKFGRKTKSGPRPVEPPYIPFPRKMHTEFWPTKKSKHFMSGEVRAAVMENWSKSGSINQTSSPKSQSAIFNSICKTNNTDNTIASFVAEVDRTEGQQHTVEVHAQIIQEPQISIPNTEGIDAEPLDLALRTLKPVTKPNLMSDQHKIKSKNLYKEQHAHSAFDRDSIEQQDQSKIQQELSFNQKAPLNDSISKTVQSQSTSVEAGTEDESEGPHVHQSIESDENFVDIMRKATPSRHARRATAVSPRICSRSLPRLRSRSAVPKLRRLSSMSETRERKRQASIFDFEDDDSSSDEESISTTPKRARTASISLNSSANDNKYLVKSPNRMVTMMCIELEPTKSTWHLPR